MPPAPYAAEVAVAVAAAQAAGELLLTRFRRAIAPAYKGHGDIVTQADLDAEDLVRERIGGQFPDDIVVGEERGHPAEFDVRGRRRWYVDPLDGTTNYVKGQPRWAVAVAFCDDDDRLAAAAIVRPRDDELLSATRGGGAWLDGRRLCRDTDPPLEEALVLVGPLTEHQSVVAELVPRTLSLRITGSTVSDLADVASGRGDVHVGERQGRWDLAAGTLVLRESGVVVTDLAGGDLAGPGDNILAASPAAHAAALALLKEL